MGVRGAARRSRKPPFDEVRSQDVRYVNCGGNALHTIKVYQHFKGIRIERDPQVVVVVVFDVSIPRDCSNRSGNEVATKVVIGTVFLDANVIVERIALGPTLISVHLDNDTGVNCRGEKIAAESHQTTSSSNEPRIGCFENKCHAVSTVIASTEQDFGLHFPAFVRVEQTRFPNGTALTCLGLSQAITIVTQVSRVVVQGELCLCDQAKSHSCDQAEYWE